MEQFRIIRIRNNIKESTEDVVAEEVPFTIIVKGEELVTLLCSPSELADLTKGFLFTSGLIKKSGDIKKIVLDKERWVANVEISGWKKENLTFKRLYTSGCGKGTIFYNANDIAYRRKITSDFRIEAARINALMLDFRKKSRIFLETGGVHSAGVADGKSILVFREDIGRHNAVDKVIGRMLSDNVSFKDKVLLSSGRISSEVLLKARKCAFPVVISKSAPTSQAVRLSKEMGITLVCFARGNRMNVYSSEERIVL
ncbi:MAG: formate dehydrogenase accessory sulfurtransferase FdhD [Omnitrophica bacterium]|nr:formate dehydrogenase accessory sulfurtransferase FdhD [Candidatus Omnitrophota bacterium]